MANAPSEPENLAHLRELVGMLLHGEPLAVLATADTPHPHCSLVGFAVSDDLREIVFATPRETRKFRNLTAEPAVSMLVDNRANRPSDFQEAMAVTAVGTASEPPGERRGALEAMFLDRHPSMKSFLQQPDSALVAVRVRLYYLVRSFQEVSEILP